MSDHSPTVPQPVGSSAHRILLRELEASKTKLVEKLAEGSRDWPALQRLLNEVQSYQDGADRLTGQR